MEKIAFGICVGMLMSMFIPLALAGKHYIGLCLHYMTLSKGNIIRKKRKAHFYLLLTFGIHEFSYICMQTVEGNPYTLSEILYSALGVLLSVGVITCFIGFFIRIIVKQKELQEKATESTKEPPSR